MKEKIGKKLHISDRTKVIIFTLIIGGIITTVLNKLCLPALTIKSSGLWWFSIINLTIWAIIAKVGELIFGVTYKFFFTKFKETIVSKVIELVLILVIVLCFVTSISGWKSVKPYEYRELVDVEEGSFEEEIPNLTEHTPLVDQKTAQKIGDRTIGKINHASWYEVSNEYNLVEIQGKYYRISELEYSGVFSWNKAKNTGIPGFVMVDAETSEAEYVEFEEPMKYTTSSYFGEDLTRILRKRYPSKIFRSVFFEVDDNLHPYWIVSVVEPQIGMRGGEFVTSVILVDAVTGKSTEYQISDAPEWIDHIHSVSYLMRLVGYHYRYSEGWWNPSKKNIYRTTYSYRNSNKEENKYTPFDGYNSMIDTDGKIWFYSGITPANSAETNIGFVMTSPRTGEVKFFTCEGAEESSAQVAAEGLVQNFGYSASFPIVINIDGVPSYFMTLKDDAGLIRNIAICNIEQYTKVVYGEADKLPEVIRAYKAKLKDETEEKGTESEGSSETSETVTDDYDEITSITGTVSAVETAEKDGNTYYYFTLEGDENIYVSTIKNSNLQPMRLKVGATVDIECYLSEEVAIVTKIKFE